MCTTSEVKESRTGRTRSITADVAADHGHQGAGGGRGGATAHAAVDDVDAAGPTPTWPRPRRCPVTPC